MELVILGMNFGCILGPLSAGKFPEKDCLLPLISKILGYLIVAGSTTAKLPQIYKILKHNSARGLSVAAFELEVVGLTISLAYCLHKGIPFSAYGELYFLLIQAIVLVAIIYYYSQPVGAKVWMKALLYPISYALFILPLLQIERRKFHVANQKYLFIMTFLVVVILIPHAIIGHSI